MKQHHFLITCFPVQGHINPSLQLAKNLARLGATVTFATTARGLKALEDRLSLLPNFSYISFSDDSVPSSDSTAYMESLRLSGSENLAKIIRDSFGGDRPVTCLVYTLIMPWASKVARDMHVPSAFLAIQCAAAFAIYRRFYSSHDGVHEGGIKPLSIQGLPTFSCSDLPTFILPQNPMNSFMGPMLIEHIQELELAPKSSLVLLNSFEELEAEAIKDFDDKLNVVAVGPLIPSAFAGGTDSADTSFGGDLFDKNEDDHFKWMESKEEKSVVYIAFGSLVVMNKEQKIEILHALVESKRPYFWVLRSSESEEDEEVKEMIESEMSNNCDSKIVTWCSQTRVLSHRSIGCFVTHSGWNSTLEGLVSGVPLVACPHFSDQTTNAKLVEEVWGNGVRARINGEVVINRQELKKCLEVVMGEGEKGEKIRENAWKWRGLALEAVKDGGSTYNNLRKVMESF